MHKKTLAKKMAQFALSKKAFDVMILDLRKLTDIADYFVLCSGESDTQVKAIAEAIERGSEDVGITAWRREGLTHRQWILLDYVDIVVHIFHKEVRKYYNLEKLWGDAKIEKIEDTIVQPVKQPTIARRRVRANA